MSSNDNNLPPLRSGPGTEAFAFREAITNPRRFIMLAGVWIVFAPTALMGACLSWLAISDKEITHGLLGIAMCLLSAAVILIATSNYFRLRK